MPAHRLVEVSCPDCGGRFVERANLLRPGGRAWCPYCEKLFLLDAEDPAQRDTLKAAELGRKRRKERLRELRRQLDIPPHPAPRPANRPMTMSDVLRNLDGLLERLDRIASNAGLTPPPADGGFRRES